MKKIHIIYSLILALFLGVTSCDDDLAMPPVVVPEGGIGTGVWDNPMTAYQALLGSVNEEIPTPWVKGYIVGYINIDVSNVLSEASAVLQPERCTVNTNLLMAMNPDETDWTKCATVQLPSGAARNALNLRDHIDNLGRLVCVKGETGSKYCGAYGVRSVSAYNWGDTGKEDGGSGPSQPTDPTEKVIYTGLEATATDIDWTFDNVTLGSGLSRVWKWTSYNGSYYLNGSAFAGGAKESLSYAISPVIDLSGMTSATATFEHAAKFQTSLRSLCGFAVRVDGSTEWTDVTIPTWPEAGSWTFVNAGNISLKDFVGKKIQIAFKYGSSATEADTWEIRNVKVTAK